MLGWKCHAMPRRAAHALLRSKNSQPPEELKKEQKGTLNAWTEQSKRPKRSKIEKGGKNIVFE
jgi:hypothetical protein